MSGLPYLAPHLSLYSPLSRCTPVIGYTWDALYPVYGISCLPNTLYTHSLYTLYPLYTPSILLYAMPYILGPSDYWIWDGMDPGTPLDMAYIGYPR